MANKTSPCSAAASSATFDRVIADLAQASQTWILGGSVVVDRSASPYGGPQHVRMPDCSGCRNAYRREPALLSLEDQTIWQDVLDRFCRAKIIADYGPGALSITVMPEARSYIDRVEGGIARMIQPGFADIAGIACPHLRADVMLALGLLQPTCACLRVLLTSLPDDTPQAAYVKAKVTCALDDETDERMREEQRSRQRSSDWSAYLRRKFEERRPAAGDLFADFGLCPDGSHRAEPPQSTRDSQPSGRGDAPGEETPPWDEDPVEPTANTHN